ncbi:MAG: SiaB family protein kinase [Flavobacteriales bacterium]|nr:SiaB family protein kinase [Flavobacteriales bacterium]MBP9079355.1 SiaB family protein kinase [Flavobacteriales bacterium]
MMDRIFDLYDDLEKQRFMVAFKGEMSPDLIGALLDLVEQRLLASEPDLRVRKRVFNVVMECLQNLYHHNRSARVQDRPALEDQQGVVLIAHDSAGYSVLTGNAMAQDQVSALKKRLDQVNGYGPKELHDLYKDTLGNGSFTRTGGGGLGLIDIARKSGQKLEYGFVPMDEKNTFFSLNVNVASRNEPK